MQFSQLVRQPPLSGGYIFSRYASLISRAMFDFPAYTMRVDGAINFILCLRPAVHAQIDARVRQYFSPYSRRLVNPMHSSLPRGGLSLSPELLFALI
jgi:hypothetical protein